MGGNYGSDCAYLRWDYA
ncbi:hypothetical protein [Sicyoidochytrium minutum DNA virus]|nr:hypothetical protein [Sicyoidochytrium minutum DNA virus]